MEHATSPTVTRAESFRVYSLALIAAGSGINDTFSAKSASEAICGIAAALVEKEATYSDAIKNAESALSDYEKITNCFHEFNLWLNDDCFSGTQTKSFDYFDAEVNKIGGRNGTPTQRTEVTLRLRNIHLCAGITFAGKILVDQFHAPEFGGVDSANFLEFDPFRHDMDAKVVASYSGMTCLATRAA